MRTGLVFMLTGAFFVAAPPFGAVARAQDSPLKRAFEQYERIRVALAQGTTEGVAAEAKALSRNAREVAGEQASRAAHSLTQATDLEQTRERFGAVSEVLVPKFLDAGLPGVQGFVCPMNRKRWVQRGAEADNPYFGKSMATCATPIKAAGKS